MYKQQLIDLLAQNSVLGIKEPMIKINHQTYSHWYANCRHLSSTHRSLQNVANIVVELIMQRFNQLDFDGVIGVPEGATLMAIQINQLLIEQKSIADNLYQLRRTPKEHGDIINKYSVTGKMPKRVIVYEDVVVSGKSLLDYIDTLKIMDIEVVAAIALVDRLQPTEEGNLLSVQMQSIQLPYIALLDANDLLPVIFAQQPEYKDKIRKEYTAQWGDKYPLMGI